MITHRHFRLIVPLGMALAGCATTPANSLAPGDGMVVDTKKVILTGSHIPNNVPTNPIAHPEPTMAPVVIMRAGDTMPFMGPAGGPF